MVTKFGRYFNHMYVLQYPENLIYFSQPVIWQAFSSWEEDKSCRYPVSKSFTSPSLRMAGKENAKTADGIGSDPDEFALVPGMRAEHLAGGQQTLAANRVC
ncbi:MAG: hypothetical protein LBE84_11780 [Planctomycetota bacterium]|jgi:hypothetical protein|nr:hypothetical protein [Planctomycetota bacterium]